MMIISKVFRVLFAIAAGALPALAGAEPPEPPDFARDIRPIFEKNCQRCHGAKMQKNDLRLDRKAPALKGGSSGPAILPGKSGRSLLYRYVAGLEPQIRMPPRGEALPAAEVALIARWIDDGARWPDGLEPPPAEEAVHWSLRLPVRPAPPEVKDPGWARDPLDRFVLARLEKERLAPAPEAERAVLIRRLTLDLHGLPPAIEEVEAFVNDRREGAWERLVDRLLSSPRYGERWAVHWLDVVRFAETSGFETNTPRENAWPYRDWVIRAFNEDLPYPRFIEEQLAGDAVGEDAATGFLVGGPYDTVKSPDVDLTLSQRLNELADMVSTTSTAFLGLTVGCARCHDHKFDPITQRDYYSIQAAFSGVEHGEREVEPPDRAEREARSSVLGKELTAIREALWGLEPEARPALPAGAAPGRPAVDPRENVDRFPPVEADRVRFTVLATNGAEPCIDELEVFSAAGAPENVALAARGAAVRSSSDLPGFGIHKLEHLNDGRGGNSRSWISAEPGAGWVEIDLPRPTLIDRVVWSRDREGVFKDRLAVRYRIEVGRKGAPLLTVATADDRRPPADIGASAGGDLGTAAEFQLLERRNEEIEAEVRKLAVRPKVYAGVFVAPKETHVLHRGDPREEREAVAPGAIACLGRPLGLPADAPERSRRLSLARWIGDPANPLTARVLVNRLWLHHFGEGIVATPSDFGANGSPPSHPELLDWLAVEMMERGWSIKAIQRLIVLSATYRQSSRPDTAGTAADAGCRLLWRFPPRRLEAEAIRDSILWASGKLDLRMGGHGYSAFEPNENYVRVYEPRKEFGPREWRRAVYQEKVRMRGDGTFAVFDSPDAGQTCPKRTRSTTPLQSLSLLNSPFVVEQAGYLAERVRREAGDAVEAQVRRAFLRVLLREPDGEEAAASARLVAAYGLKALCRSLFNSNEFLFLE